jgi:N-acetylneuraminic acid mutarotase
VNTLVHPRRWSSALPALVALVVLAAAHAAAATELGPGDRVRCQAALERVYWSHRTPASDIPFADAVPDAVIRRRAEDALLKTEALRRNWGLTVAPEQLQAELDRMAEHSQAPERLRELFAALGDDPTTAAECLARPLLVDRLLRASYARDRRLHGESRARAELEAAAAASPARLKQTTGVVNVVEWRRGLDRPLPPGLRALPADEFDARLRQLALDIGRPGGDLVPGVPSPLREDDVGYSVTVVDELGDEHVRLTSVEWPKRSFDSWWAEARQQLVPSPSPTGFPYRLPDVARASCVDDTWRPTLALLDPRYWHTAVWTGSEMIVFGGMSSVGTIYGDGSRYDPATDTWTLLPTAGAPAPRQSHVAVWTGAEMVVWGGRADAGGGRYDPVTDSWRPTSLVNAPTPRVNATVIWTGSEMVVWGGEGPPGLLNSGGRYNPVADSWTATAPSPLAPRAYHTAVWTGSKMIVWGGYNVHIGQLYGDGAGYRPATNSWTTVAAVNAPDARTYHTAVWSGTEMIVWGGANEPAYDQSGGRYNPTTDTWTPTSMVNPPSLRWFHVAIWTGSEMIVQGGSFGVTEGGRYDPATDTWTATSPLSSANNGQGLTAVWTGTEMIVWGGLDDNFFFHNDGGCYDPALDLWRPTGTMNVPTARGLHSAEWTGSEMIVWGGFSSGVSRPGGLYDPATDSWRALTTLGAPYGRENATAVWTGSEVIFWGGEPDGNPWTPGTGGRYSPASDSWVLTSTVNAPTNRYGHSAVWTGSEMIVFGGLGAGDNVAKRYSPATDSWVDATLTNAPGERDHHAAVWSGSEMIIWGGFINEGTTPTGGRYNPVADVWTPTNVGDSPITRMWPIGVWTGTEMIVWGGNDWLFLGDLGDGARYNPSTDSWSPTSMIGAPTPRIAQGVWTGGELVLWGGANDASGGRYDPSTDSWRPTTLQGAPDVRVGGRWSTVWTGTEMIVWGGIVDTQEGSRYCVAPAGGVFADGFESGSLAAWSAFVP